MTAKHANNLPGIIDSEVFSYLGQDVKVPGSVFTLLIRPLGTALAVLENVTLVAMRFLLAALSLILTASHSHAGLRWSFAQFEQQYGKPVLDQEQIAGRVGYVFKGDDYVIVAFFRNTEVLRILYICRGGSVFDWGRARALLRTNAPDATWDDASKDEADNTYRVNGSKDGVESYYASLTDDGKMLAIWTKEDDEAGRTKPNLDTPLVSAVVGSTEKSTGEVIAGQVPSSESQWTPEINHPDVTANATPSPAQQPVSAHPSPTKIAKVRPRSSIPRREISHVANFAPNGKPAVSSPQQLAAHPAPTPLLMNAGTGLYNSDYTQPFKEPKKAPGQ